MVDHLDGNGFGVVTETNATAGDRYKWTGREYDGDTGLQFNRARYFDGGVGRWTSEDPLGFGAGDVNLYRYVINSSTNYTDPSGQDKLWLRDGQLWGPLYIVPGVGGFYSDAWSLFFPQRTRDYLKAPLHKSYDPNQTDRFEYKAGDIIDRDTRDGHNQTVQGLKSTLADAAIQAATLTYKGVAPNATDPKLVAAYSQMWRKDDLRPGGTIGELLREVKALKAGGKLDHLIKAKERLRQLIKRVNDYSEPLSKADRAGAERVIGELKEVIRIAEGALKESLEN